MKIIINESQLRLIVENEEKNLLDFTGHKNNPEDWDDMFEYVNRKKGGNMMDIIFMIILILGIVRLKNLNILLELRVI